MNNCPDDNENEREIKVVILVYTLIFILGFLALFFFTGCSPKVVEPWSCECDCEKSKFECNGQTMHIDIKEIK